MSKMFKISQKNNIFQIGLTIRMNAVRTDLIQSNSW